MLRKLLPKDFDAISVKYINKFIPKLIFPALNIGIFLEYFLINFSSFFENPVVPITTLFFNFNAIFKTSNVHLGTVKSIIKLAFLKDSSVLKLGLIPATFLLTILFSVSPAAYELSRSAYAPQ